MRLRWLGALVVAALALLAACSGTEESVETSAANVPTEQSSIVTVEPEQPETTEAAAALPTAEFGSVDTDSTASSSLEFEEDPVADPVNVEEAAPQSEDSQSDSVEPAAEATTAAEPTAPDPTEPSPTATAEPLPTATPEPAPTAAPAGVVIGLPSVPVIDLATGAEVNLNAISPAGPALLWFWAPH